MHGPDSFFPRRTQAESAAASFLLLLLIADLTFIGLHFVHHTTPLGLSGMFALGRDRGYAEFYQYIKFLWVIVLLLAVGVMTRKASYLAWMTLFAYLLLDDALQFHETFGAAIATHFNFTAVFRLRAQDYGELAVTALAAAPLLVLLALGYWRGSDLFRQTTRHLLLFLGALAFFGVLIDMLHIAAGFGRLGSAVLEALEDGGEMVVISVVVWYVFLLNLFHGYAGFSPPLPSPGPRPDRSVD